jgi:hypothetical protein
MQQATAQTWEIGQPSIQIGVVDQPGPGHEVFSYMLDIAVDSAGNLLILDEDNPTIRAFDARGRFVDVAGRRGAGPGEFRRPWTVGLGVDGRIDVLDPGNARISTYRLSDNELRYSHDTPITFSAIDICLLGSRRYLLAREGLLLREVNAAGRIVREFGERERAEGELRRILGGSDGFLNNGLLACHEEADVVVLVHVNFGIVRAFSADGVELWRQELPDWHQQRFRRTASDGCCEYNIPDAGSGTFHYATALAPAGEAGLYLVLAERRPETNQYRYEIRELAVTDGREVSRTRSTATSQPLRFLNITRSRMYAYTYRPFPQVLVFERE